MAAGQAEVVAMSATGNRFAVVDGFDDAVLDDVAGFAQSLAGRVDGVLLLLPPIHGGDCRMVLYNADGSRPEACGNGLRCIARRAVERGHVERDHLVIETDAGFREACIVRRDGSVLVVSVSMGAPRVEDTQARLETTRGTFTAVLVNMGNPHCVVFVDDVQATDVEGLGASLEHHERFPNRTNVEFVAVQGDGLDVRIWERGVGETESCGTGVSAAAVAAIERGVVRSPVHVRTPGGELSVQWTGTGEVRLEGPVDEAKDLGDWVAGG